MTPLQRSKMEAGLREWHDSTSECRRRFDEADAQSRYERMFQPMEDAIEASRRITEDDLLIRFLPLNGG